MNYASLKRLSGNLDNVERFFKNNLLYFESRGLSGEVYYILKNIEAIKNVVKNDLEYYEKRISKWLDD